MSRLTTVNWNGEIEVTIDNEFRILRKLSKLEDIEDELGCPLDVVFKALKDKEIIFKHIVGLENPKITLETPKVVGLGFSGKYFDLWLCDSPYGDEFCVNTNDYKKTWWLKEDAGVMQMDEVFPGC